MVFSRTWYGAYRQEDATKETLVNLGVTDKAVAITKLNRIVSDLVMERHGMIPPKKDRDAAAKPLARYVEEFVRNLTARGKTAEYAYYIEKRLEKLIAGCGWELVRDITPESFERWRSAQVLAAKTKNEYLNAAITFLNWILRNRRNENPLLAVERVETRGCQTRKRRALGDEELRRFIEVAGSERAVVYTVAALTGIRRKELSRLVWGDFEDAGGSGCYLNLRSSTTKNKQSARLPLHAVVRELLRQVKPEEATAETAIFASIPSMYMLKKDLAAAGIEYKDEQGRQFDFHALRHTYGTLLQRSNVPLAVAMILMRHKDPRLTAKTYVDASQLPVAKAVEEIGWLGGKSAEKGTEKGTEPDVVPCPDVSHDVHGTESAHSAGTLINTAFAANLSQNVTPCPTLEKAASLGLEPRQAESESAVLPITPRGISPERWRVKRGGRCVQLFFRGGGGGGVQVQVQVRLRGESGPWLHYLPSGRVISALGGGVNSKRDGGSAGRRAL